MLSTKLVQVELHCNRNEQSKNVRLSWVVLSKFIVKKCILRTGTSEYTWGLWISWHLMSTMVRIWQLVRWMPIAKYCILGSSMQHLQKSWLSKLTKQKWSRCRDKKRHNIQEAPCAKNALKYLYCHVVSLKIHTSKKWWKHCQKNDFYKFTKNMVMFSHAHILQNVIASCECWI